MLDFHWKVPETGFEWATGKPVSGPEVLRTQRRYLCYKDAGSVEPIAFRTYEPLREGGLFINFASLVTTESSLLEFANRYGCLGDLNTVFGKPARPQDEENSYYAVKGEQLEIWIREIELMRHAIQMWKAVKSGDSKFISQFVRHHDARDAGWMKEGFSYTSPLFTLEEKPRKVFLGSPATRPDIAPLFGEENINFPGRLAVQHIVNERMEALQVRPRLQLHREKGSVREVLQVLPYSLISALWVQFAQSIEGNREYRQCDECRRWHEVSGERRADARFCSDACRFRAYRERQKEARRMHSEGNVPKEIARALGSDLKTVKGWISKQSVKRS